MNPRRFTAPVVGAGGCRAADLRGIGFHGRGVSDAAWAGVANDGARRPPRET
jgi:hypothetical protein